MVLPSLPETGSGPTAPAVPVRPEKSAELRTTLARGLLLHTDIATAERTTDVDKATGARTLRVLDGRRVDAQRFSIHWGLGRQLADALARDTQTAPIALAWYRAVGALFQQWADLGQLSAHLSAASDTLPDDPVLLLYRGSLHQAYADARVQAYLEPLLVDRRGHCRLLRPEAR